MRKRGQISSSVLDTVLVRLPKAYTDLLDKFLADLDIRPTSKATYRRSILQFYLFLADQEIHLLECERSTIVKYKLHLLEQVEKQQFSLLTADNYLNAVKRFFDWIFNSDALPEFTKNIASKISINAEYEGFKKEALTADQVQLLLKNCWEKVEKTKTNETTPTAHNQQLTAYRNYAFVFLMVTSGVRSITTTRMNVGDIALLHNTPIIYVQRKGHSDKSDFIVLEAEPNKAIVEYIQLRFGVSNFEKLTEADLKMPLFAGHSNRNNNARLTPDRLRQVVKQHLRLIGLNAKVFSAHSLRHTYGTLQLRLTNDIFQVAENMGHKDLKSTKRYTAKERQRQRLENYTNLAHLFKK
jgi:integrase/recombinase XerD